MIREPFEFMYTLIENDYYNYKRSQTEFNLYVDTTDVAYARDFFNICQNGEAWEKKDDVGRVAFMPSAMSIRSTIDKIKDDYHSAIEYVFEPAPIGRDGGFAYLSPAHGIAVNKGSANLEWSERFISFLFAPENNKLFAEQFNIIPNTKEAFDYISSLFSIPGERISHLGQVTFNYGFYEAVTKTLLDVSKANNPKYMQTGEDGSVSLYPLDYYMNELRESLKGND